jgi:hypothetical protein
MESENFTYFHNIFNHNKNIYSRRLAGTQGKDHLPSASGPSILQRDDCPRTTQADGRFPSQPCRQMPGRGVSYTREPNSPPRLRLIPPSSSRLPRRPQPRKRKKRTPRGGARVSSSSADPAPAAAMAAQERRTIDLEEGWAFMQKGITKLKNILEGKPEPQFSSEDYMMLYTFVLLPPFPSLVSPRSGSDLGFWEQDDLQHVHPEAAARLLAAALRQVPRVVRGIHHLHGTHLFGLPPPFT